jgi:hypothetical protein
MNAGGPDDAVVRVGQAPASLDLDFQHDVSLKTHEPTVATGGFGNRLEDLRPLRAISGASGNQSIRVLSAPQRPVDGAEHPLQPVFGKTNAARLRMEGSSENRRVRFIQIERAAVLNLL